MRILIFNANYEPDLGPSAPLFTMLCENLVKIGHQVTMITTVPHYPSGYVPLEYRGKWLWRSIEKGVDIVRVNLPSVDRSKLPRRLLQFLVYQLGTTWAGLGKKYDVVFSGSSSLSAWLSFAVLVTLRRKPAVYGVYDVYPGVGMTLGVFRHKPVIALMTAMERSCLDNAMLVRIISDSFRPELRAMGVPDEKMIRGYDWVDTELVHPGPKDNGFSREHDLVNKFVVMYAGNLGLSQGLDIVLSAADMLKMHQDIQIVFVGDGANRESLVSNAEKRQLTNVKFIPFQPRKQLPEVLASADVSLVSLQRGIGSGSLPSKTYSIFASGRPVIASVDEDSDASNLIRQSEGGICIPPGDPSALVETILMLKNDPALCERLGQKGRIWAEQHHSPHVGAREIEKLLLEAVSLKKCRKK